MDDQEVRNHPLLQNREEVHPPGDNINRTVGIQQDMFSDNSKYDDTDKRIKNEDINHKSCGMDINVHDSKPSSNVPGSNLKIYSDRILGNGSYSKVFPGKYKDNMVAVKIISTKHLDKKITKQLERELDVIRLLQGNPHPNIATYYKIFRAPDKMIIVMELCSGGELTKYIKSGLDLDTIRNYFSQILQGYKHLLMHNIVHRDIKSANLLLSDDKTTVKFIDFGLSKIFSVDLNSTICGSPLYMAPELLNHQDYDSKADIWSLGILLYEMVYGVTPFHDCKYIAALKRNVQSNNIGYPEMSAKSMFRVPLTLIRYMMRLLELDPARRINWNELEKSEWFNNGTKSEETDLPKLEKKETYGDHDEFDESSFYDDTDSDVVKQSSKHDTGSANIKTSSTPGPVSVGVSDLYEYRNTLTKKTPNTVGSPSMLAKETCDNKTVGTRTIPNITNIQRSQKTLLRRGRDSDPEPAHPFITDDDIVDDEDSDFSDDHDDSHTERAVRPQSGEKRSEPIPIGRRSNNNYGGHKNVDDEPSRFSTRGRSYDQLYGRSATPNRNYIYGVSPPAPVVQGESFGDVRMNNLTINDISVIDNLPEDEYDALMKKQSDKTSDSGLIDINYVNDILIANVPERTTAFEYISKGSSVVGSYLYSRSAPIASTLINGIGKVAKQTAETIGIISPKQ